MMDDPSSFYLPHLFTFLIIFFPLTIKPSSLPYPSHFIPYLLSILLYINKYIFTHILCKIYTAKV